MCVECREYCERIFNEIDFYASIFTFYEFFFLSFSLSLFLCALFILVLYICARTHLLIEHVHFDITSGFYNKTTLIRKMSESSEFFLVFACFFFRGKSKVSFNLFFSKFLYKNLNGRQIMHNSCV